MDPHPYGWLSLVPSLVAIVLAIATRRVVASLAIGILVGAMITCDGNIVQAVRDTLQLHLWKSLVEEDRLRVFAFTVLMGAMVGVIQWSGGMTGLVETVSKWARNRRRGQLATWALGLVVFFDDYANTVLLGNTLQPLCNRLRISREKLAYLVDSTAAPVSGLAIVSTWVAVEIDFVQSGLQSIAGTDATESTSAFTLFIRSIPYRFYVLWALAFVFLVSWMQRDYGPMLTAERRTLDDPSATIPSPSEAGRQAAGWWNAVVPIVGTVVAVLWFLYQSGVAAQPTGDDGQHSLWQVFGAADSYSALLWGSLLGLVIAVVMTWCQRLLSWDEIEDATAYGAKLMVPALAVLWLASALSAMTGHDVVPDRPVGNPDAPYAAQAYRLYTGEYLAGLLADDDPQTGEQLAKWMPTLIFIVSAGIAFSTGASWGTMAIVMPVAIPLAHGALMSGGQGESVEWSSHPIMLGTVGSVLAGAIFGDHCSPISDTTVLSSQSCGCDHTAHVWTQLPYALTVGTISIVCGTLPIGFGFPVLVCMPLGIIAMFVTLYLLGSETAAGS